MTVDSASAANSPKRSGFWFKNRFAVLLGALILLFSGSPLLRSSGDKSPFDYASLVITILFVIVLLSAIFAVSRSRTTVTIALFLAFPTAIAQALQSWKGGTGVGIALVEYTLGVLFLGYVVILILRYLFEKRRVTVDMICASLCVYLLLGVLWAILYSFFGLLDPEAFKFSFAEAGETDLMRFGSDRTFIAIYYSLVTMSTLGYGDIIPTSSLTRMCAALQAVVGQLYLVVLVARLVGLQIAQSSENAPSGQGTG